MPDPITAIAGAVTGVLTGPKLAKATIKVHDTHPPRDIPIQFNPTSVKFDKTVTQATIDIPGLDSPVTQFVHGQAAKLTLVLFFDTSDYEDKAKPVTAYTNELGKLAIRNSDTHAPPICTFFWGENPFVGGAFVGSAFRCVVETVSHEFTMFSTNGTPVRATVNLTLREYRSFEVQQIEANLKSPDRTHVHVVARGDRLSALAERHYQSAATWRPIAEENGLDDPRRLRPGTILSIPRII
jgi:nucleoid-associated protein YgaU